MGHVHDAVADADEIFASPTYAQLPLPPLRMLQEWQLWKQQVKDITRVVRARVRACVK